MNENQQSTNRTPRRYRRRSTKRRPIFRPPSHPGRFVAIILTFIIVVALALVWGNALKRQSDALRAAKEADQWTLPIEEAIEEQVGRVPSIRAYEIKPEGNVGDIIIAGSHEGIILPLRDSDGALYYRSETAKVAGISLSEGAPSLPEDVARIARRELRVTGVFHVTCFDANDLATQTYLRGLELALLCEYASSGMDDILIVNLPCGDDASDALAIAFLEDLRKLMNTLQNPPAIGVAVSLSAIEGKTGENGLPLYAGDISPARIARVSDYLALDLRYRSTEEIDVLLPRLAYAYQRHGLRMMVDQNSSTAAEELFRHGFTRVFEMKASETT